jgi:uncharacterized protein YndB with AHSA1/START domain
MTAPPLPPLPHSLERSVLICAQRDTVFRYFTDSARFAAWWGEGSSIDGRRGGAVRIRYPDGSTASGEVLEVVAGERIVFTYGYDDPAKPIPPGASRVTIMLEERADGTLVRLRHDVADAAVRDVHVPGWRYQLSRFANVVAGEQHAAAGDVADRWFAAWSAEDPASRRTALAAATTETVAFRDAFGCTDGRGELEAHIAAARVHLPGVAMAREGEVRQCQGTALVDWVARAPGGAESARGTNVFELAPDGRIARAVGLWQA